jgi:hypothetical protein
MQPRVCYSKGTSVVLRNTRRVRNSSALIYQDGNYFKTNKQTSVREDMEKLEASCAAGGNIKGHSCHGK